MPILIFLFAAGLTSCTLDDCACDSRIDAFIEEFGDPGNVDYEQGVDVNAEIYDYCAENGFIATFEWGDGVAGCCNFSIDSSVCEETADDDTSLNAADQIVSDIISGETVSIELDVKSEAGDFLFITITESPNQGELTTTSDGASPSVIYAADQDFTGTDAFTYEAEDTGGNYGSATVTLLKHGSDEQQAEK